MQSSFFFCCQPNTEAGGIREGAEPAVFDLFIAPVPRGESCFVGVFLLRTSLYGGSRSLSPTQSSGSHSQGEDYRRAEISATDPADSSLANPIERQVQEREGDAGVMVTELEEDGGWPEAASNQLCC